MNKPTAEETLKKYGEPIWDGWDKEHFLKAMEEHAQRGSLLTKRDREAG